MKVTIVGRTGGPTTGLSNYLGSLARALAALGVEISVRQPALPPFPRWLVRLARRAGFDLRAFFTTYPLAVGPRGSTDLLHLSSQNLASALAMGALGRCVVTVHDLVGLGYRHDPELTGYMTRYDRVFDDLSRLGLKRADRLIADSAHTRAEIVRLVGYPADRITVVHLAVDHAVFRPLAPAPAFYGRHDLDPAAPYILYVGSEDPRKNLRRLLDAFARVSAAIPEAVLLKVGAARFAAQRQELIDRIERLGLGRRVRFFDQVSAEDLPRFYGAARVFAFPTLYEGFGLPALEAMACGTPVVCSGTTSLPEVVGDAAITVDPLDAGTLADALRRVLEDDALGASLRNRGLTRAAGFTWERTARQTISVYGEVRQAGG